MNRSQVKTAACATSVVATTYFLAIFEMFIVRKLRRWCLELVGGNMHGRHKCDTQLCTFDQSDLRKKVLFELVVGRSGAGVHDEVGEWVAGDGR